MGLFSTLSGGHCTCCAEHKLRAEQLETKLFAEIDSNRLRESEWANALLTATNVRGHVGPRTPLITQNPPPDVIDPEESTSESFERWLDQVADGYIKDAEENGFDYTEDKRLLLKAEIRLNPEKYMT